MTLLVGPDDYMTVGRNDSTHNGANFVAFEWAHHPIPSWYLSPHLVQRRDQMLLSSKQQPSTSQRLRTPIMITDASGNPIPLTKPQPQQVTSQQQIQGLRQQQTQQSPGSGMTTRPGIGNLSGTQQSLDGVKRQRMANGQPQPSGNSMQQRSPSQPTMAPPQAYPYYQPPQPQFPPALPPNYPSSQPQFSQPSPTAFSPAQYHPLQQQQQLQFQRQQMCFQQLRQQQQQARTLAQINAVTTQQLPPQDGLVSVPSSTPSSYTASAQSGLSNGSGNGLASPRHRAGALNLPRPPNTDPGREGSGPSN